MKLSTRTRYGVRLMMALVLNYVKTAVFFKYIAKEPSQITLIEIVDSSRGDLYKKLS